MQTHEIVRRFTAHFENAGHTRVPSASLILDDPQLLFVNAGMVQFKPYFLGDVPPPYPRATSIQKCVRTPRHRRGRQDHPAQHVLPDGRQLLLRRLLQGRGDRARLDAGHRLARTPAATASTRSGSGSPSTRPTTRPSSCGRRSPGCPRSASSAATARTTTGTWACPVPVGPARRSTTTAARSTAPRAARSPTRTATWRSGTSSSCRTCAASKSPKKGHPPIGELPHKNIDTGMGVERVAFLLQGVDNVYETDLVRPVIARAEELSGRPYGADTEDDVRFRVIADHARSGVMIIGDGVTPGNEGRGYVLRRLLRRIVRSARLLGVHEPVLEPFAEVVRDAMAPSYPELATDFERISAVVRAEEETFLATLTRRLADLRAPRSPRRSGPGGSTLPGDQAFQLHDTYGFPIDLTLEMAAEAGLQVDQERFPTLMDEQRTRAKADAAERKVGHGDASVYRAVLDTHGATDFLGYTDAASEARVVGLLRRRRRGARRGRGRRRSRWCSTAPRSTPRPAASRPTPADHRGRRSPSASTTCSPRSPACGCTAAWSPPGGDARRRRRRRGRRGPPRRDLARPHRPPTWCTPACAARSASSAAQAGSLNAPGRLRFDFTSPTGAVPAGRARRDRGRGQLGPAGEPRGASVRDDDGRGPQARRDDAVRREVRRPRPRRRHGRLLARAVRWHARRAAPARSGLVKVLSEASIGSGVRRVEALVGLDAFRHLSTRARAGQPARRAAQGPPGGAARADRLAGRAAAHGRARPGEGARRRRAVLGRVAGRGGRGPRRHGARRRHRPGRRDRQRPAHARLGRARPAGRRCRVWSRCSPSTERQGRRSWSPRRPPPATPGWPPAS